MHGTRVDWGPILDLPLTLRPAGTSQLPSQHARPKQRILCSCLRGKSSMGLLAASLAGLLACTVVLGVGASAEGRDTKFVTNDTDTYTVPDFHKKEMWSRPQVILLPGAVPAGWRSGQLAFSRREVVLSCRDKVMIESCRLGELPAGGLSLPWPTASACWHCWPPHARLVLGCRSGEH